MKAEVTTDKFQDGQDFYSQAVNLVSIDVDHTATINIVSSGVEVERYDEDGNRTSQVWMDMPEFLKLFTQ